LRDAVWQLVAGIQEDFCEVAILEPADARDVMYAAVLEAK
jgi:hypothetical protein